ncbi:MAG: hypothetical protein ACW98D_03210 [Promethearchaeota archaeon]|jgi:hypothetical protein
MITKEDLEDLLDLRNRNCLYDKILNKLKSYAKLENVYYSEFKTSEGKIPIITLAKSLNPEEFKNVKMFVGAQHNEYNGLFGSIEFLDMLENSVISIDEFLKDHDIIIMAPLMNPYGFLHPRKGNKSGYYLRNGANLNRFWRRTFAPEYQDGEDDLINFDIPEHAKILKKVLEEFWKREEIQVYILDFHETSLLERFSEELNNNLRIDLNSFKFSHWLKEGIIYNVIKLYDIKFNRKPLFYKSNPNANFSHINLPIAQLNVVCKKLQEYISTNKGKLKFYFCYSNKSKEFCKRLAQKIYNNLKDILWETYFPAFNHNFNNHGCFVNMNDVVIRKGVYSMELESQKHFFNIFDEIEKSKTQIDYFDKKIKIMNLSIRLVVESIKEMLILY